jgi:hypothetical protein
LIVKVTAIARSHMRNVYESIIRSAQELCESTKN